MRPFKHVARAIGSGEKPEYQNVLGIDIARFAAPWGEVPIVATTELDRITLYYWNGQRRVWESFERLREALAADGSTPEAPLAWNWSDRVAVACSSDTVHVVYKRMRFDGSGETTALVIERYRPVNPDPAAADQRLDFVDSTDLLVEQLRFQIGRSLFAACDSRGRLIVVVQSRASNQLLPTGEWRLGIHRVTFDTGSAAPVTEFRDVDDGGHDLDARLERDRLVAVYRRTPEAFRIPLAMMLGGRQIRSGADSDSFYEPLRLLDVDLAVDDLDRIDPAFEQLPGGQHPQIQSISPLLITFDRPDRLDLALDPPVPVLLPPARHAVIWSAQRTDKIAWLRDGSETFRGVLLTSDERTIPRSHAGFGGRTLLFNDEGGLLTHASPFRNFPVWVLALSRDTKLLTVDLLHHRDFRGLYRTRLGAELSDGVLSVSERAFEVWDIGHRQIGDPERRLPSAVAENDQFQPTGERVVASSSRVRVEPVTCDNTMGGHLVADLSQRPVGFFAYSDLGDGGLRVIFAPDIPAPGEPPPIDNEKLLRPEQVTGPHLTCDEWIELEAEDWIDAELPGYSVGIATPGRSLGSALEVPLDFLLDAAAIVSGSGGTPDGNPIEPWNGMSRAQLESIDVFRAGLAPTEPMNIATTDGREAIVTLTPGGLLSGVDISASVTLDGASPTAFFTAVALDLPTPLPPGPILPQDLPTQSGLVMVFAGNPATLRFPEGGRFRLSVFFPSNQAGRPPGASIDVDVSESTYESLIALYDSVADAEAYRIGDLNASLLQYDIRYGVPSMAEDPSNIRITAKNRALQVKFAGGHDQQGQIESRSLMSFSSNEMRLKHGLDLVFHVKSFTASFRYGRAYTPGLLLRDQRLLDALSGDEGASETIRRNDATRHAAIGGKPVGDAAVSEATVDIDIEMNPGAIAVTAVISALLVMGATAAVAVIIGLVTAVEIAIAAGPLGAVALVAAVAALTIYVAIEVPKVAKRYAREQAEATLYSEDMRRRLAELPLARYSGEGTAEAIARKALKKARELQLAVPEPASPSSDGIGTDRMRGQLFQMIFVSDRKCRVLLRIDDCVPGETPGVRPPPTPPGDDGGPVVIVREAGAPRKEQAGPAPLNRARET